MEHKLYPERRLQHLISAPFIYMIIIPTVILDVFLEVYQHVCFPLYGLPLIARSEYIRIDRQKLSYLNGLQKVNCMYCGYVNGLFHYAVSIGAATEKYWCGIMHNQDGKFQSPAHHKDFLPYNDEVTFREFTEQKKDPVSDRI